MKFDTLIMGGGLAGMVAGIALQQAGKNTAIVSMGQNALHFFSGTFESLQTPSERLSELFSAAGIRVQYREGVRLMPLGTFKEAALSLDDIDLFPTPKFGKRVLIVNFPGYHDFFSSFLAEGLEKQGMECRIRFINFTELDNAKTHGEMRSVQIARAMDRIWEKVAQEIRLLLKDEDTVILPQVFGLLDDTIPGRLRQAIPARVVFAGTMPPSVPGVRTQMQLRRRYELLGGTFLMGDEAIRAHEHDGVVHSIATHNLDAHYLEADNFILATGGLFSKGLRSNPFQISEPILGLDIDHPEDRNEWYNPTFAGEQPYMNYGVKTDEHLHAIKDGVALKNVYAIGSILGNTRKELGSGAGLAIRSAFAVVDEILAEQS